MHETRRENNSKVKFCPFYIRFINFYLLTLFYFITYAQDKKINHEYGLLENPFIQIEATEAINSMYNFEFEKSKSHFIYLKKKYPWHPLPYILIGLNYWWRIVPNFENKQWDDEFKAYLDTAQTLSELLIKKHHIEGAFFLSVSHAFKGRFYSERGYYRKAAFAGSSALRYLEKCRGYETYSPELLFGDALFNYYSEWIREEYPMLRPIMLFFSKGDKAKGIRQLKETSRNAFYCRTEAQNYLMQILAIEQNNIEEALQVAGYLYKLYPNNAYFHKYYARFLYQSGQYYKTKTISLDILNKLDSAYTGYEGNSGRYATFYLAHINYLESNYEKAKQYYQISMQYSVMAHTTHRGYYYYSLLYLGIIAEKQNDKLSAKKYFRKLIKSAPRKHSAAKNAKQLIKKI